MRSNVRSLRPEAGDICRILPRILFAELAVIFLLLFFSHGELSGVFFFNNPDDVESGFSYRDVGMDFFNSIATVAGGDPYGKFQSNYPPLASLFFLLTERFLPIEVSAALAEAPPVAGYIRGGELDLRTYQQPMLLFLLFCAMFFIGFYAVISRYLGERAHAKSFAAACCLSHGVLFAAERGNLMLLALLGSMIFLAYYDSETRWKSELALLALAAAAGLKLYPAIFGLLLLREKRWGQALRTILYGVALFLLPMLPFGGVRAIGEYLGCLLSFSETHNPACNYGLPIISSLVGSCVSRLFGLDRAAIHGAVSAVVTGITVLLLALGVLKSEKRWEQCLYLSAAVVLLQPSDTYTLAFYLLPLVLMAREEGKIGNCRYGFFVLLPLVLWLPLVRPAARYYLTVSAIAAMLAQGAIVLKALLTAAGRFRAGKRTAG